MAQMPPKRMPDATTRIQEKRACDPRKRKVQLRATRGTKSEKQVQLHVTQEGGKLGACIQQVGTRQDGELTEG